MTPQYASHPNPILITGANRGLGLSVAKALSMLGQSMVLIGRTKEGLNKAIGENELLRAKAVVCDFSKDPASEIDRHLRECGPISGVIHCASMFGGSLTQCVFRPIETTHSGRLRPPVPEH